MSLPWTTRLSLDFFKSRVRVSVSGQKSMRNQGHMDGNRTKGSPSPPSSKSRTLETLTLMTPRKPWSLRLNFFWSNIWTDITEESLTALYTSERRCQIEKRRVFRDEHVKAFVPVGVEGLLDGRGRHRLVAVDSYDGERVGQAEDIAPGQPVGSDDW
jgi:hypothetical protein